MARSEPIFIKPPVEKVGDHVNRPVNLIKCATMDVWGKDLVFYMEYSHQKTWRFETREEALAVYAKLLDKYSVGL